MAETIGIVGTGRMGTAIGKRLIETGHTVSAWNRTAERVSALEDAGATRAESPAALASGASIIITSLTDKAAIDAAMDGPSGLLSGDVSGKLIIEMSTILPDEQQALAQTVRARGAAYVECPVGGTVAPALKGQLLGLAGGTADDFARARPVLDNLCKRVELLGDVGAGSAMKLAVNLPLAVYWVTLGEAVSLLPSEGFDGERIVSLIADSSAGPTVLKNRGEIVARSLNGETVPGTFDVNGLLKDLRLALVWAERNGKSLPMTQAATARYSEAVTAGLGKFDGACVAKFVLGA